jgi:PKD repeat protein
MKRMIVLVTIACAMALLLGGSLLESMDQGKSGAQAARLNALLALLWEEDFSADLPPDTYYVTSTEGSGLVEDGSFLLTQNAPSQRGRIFNLTPYTMDEFGAYFKLFLGNDPSGADGAAFIFCPSYDYTPDAGGTLDASCPNGYIVGFDNWEWGEYYLLPDVVYIAYGSHDNRLTQVVVPELATGGWHEAIVALDEGAITVMLDGVTIIDEFAIPGYESFTGYFGFSAATGASINEHRVDDIQVHLEAGLGQLEGYVYDEGWWSTIAGATVIGEDTDGSSWSATTDSSGHYSLWVPAGTYTLTAEHPLYFSNSVTGVEVLDDELAWVDIGLTPVVTIEPDMLESWLVAGTEELTHPTGLEITNQGDMLVDFQLYDWEPTFILGDDDSSIASLSGSYVEFDPSAGGDFNYIPGTSQTFCLRAESYTDDYEWVENVYERFPSDWTVSDVYLQGTPTCDLGGTFGEFSWGYHLDNPNEINISHPRYQANPSDHCVATYCFDVTSGAGIGDALVSWYWLGDFNSTICSADGYTPEGADACQEAIQPQAEVPIDPPWVWEDPLNGSIAPGEAQQVEVSFSADGLALGDYTADIGLLARSGPMAYYQPVRGVWVIMHVVEAFSDPLPSFESNAPVYPGNTVIFTNTSEEGLPPTEYYVWDFGDGSTLTTPTTGSVRHSYAEAGSYIVTLTAHQAQTGVEVDYSADIEVMGFDFLITEPAMLESWLVAGTSEFTHPTGLVITNQGDTTVDYQLYDWEPTFILGDDDSSIASLSGSYVEFDPSAGGDFNYIPGTSQTFCLRAESYTDDYEWVENVYERFPSDWTVSDVYLQGTPTCDLGGTFGEFSWGYHLDNPNEINISHPRYQANPSDHCVATYCFDVTSGAGIGDALVSWYWLGDRWGSEPHSICSSDGYTPDGALACQEAVQPQAEVPMVPDSPWVWQDPLSGAISPGEVLPVEVSFSAVVTDPLPLGDYTAILGLWGRYDPLTYFGLAREIEVTMHVVEAFSDPLPSFESNATVRSGETLTFTNTSEEGVPSTEYYLWDFGDGTTLNEPTASPVSHVYTSKGTYTVSLTAHQSQTGVEVEYTAVIEVTSDFQIFLPTLLNE